MQAQYNVLCCHSQVPCKIQKNIIFLPLEKYNLFLWYLKIFRNVKQQQKQEALMDR